MCAEVAWRNTVKARNSVYRNIQARLRNNCCHGKTINITYPERVFAALVIQHAKWMRGVLSSAACPAVPYFFTLSHEWYDFRKRY